MSTIKTLAKNHKGFSLLEIVMVITLIGILSVGGLYSYGKYIDESRLAAAKAEVAMVDMAMAQYDVSVAKLDNSKVCGALGVTTCLANLKTQNLITSNLAYNGKYSCTANVKTQGKYPNGTTNKYVFYYSNCEFHTSAIEE